MVSNKVFIVVLVIAIILVSFAFCVALNVGGLGTSLSGVGGPIAKGLYNILNTVPIWISSGGWPTLAVGILAFVVVIPVLAAYLCWHTDLPYKITGAPNSETPGFQQGTTQTIPVGNLQQTTSNPFKTEETKKE
jgi:hypothetical protein